MSDQSRRIVRAQAALLLVDIQERLLPAISEKERVLRHATVLAKAAGILGLPVFVTEQYRKGLGATMPELAVVIPGFEPIEKLTFSSARAPGLVESLRAKGVRDVILCGIEAHVCVCQTCLDLLGEGFTPFVVADAISSRTLANHQAGMHRMCDAGAVLVSTEMILFELLERAGTDEFKQILELVK